MLSFKLLKQFAGTTQMHRESESLIKYIQKRKKKGAITAMGVRRERNVVEEKDSVDERHKRIICSKENAGFKNFYKDEK